MESFEEKLAEIMLIPFDGMSSEEIISALSEIDEDMLEMVKDFLLLETFRNGKMEAFENLAEYFGKENVRGKGYENFVDSKEKFEAVKEYLDPSFLDYVLVENLVSAGLLAEAAEMAERFPEHAARIREMTEGKIPPFSKRKRRV